jgi:hypothetical protein
MEQRAMLHQAKAFLLHEGIEVGRTALGTLDSLSQDRPEDFHEWALSLVTINIAVLLEYGREGNVIWQLLGNSDEEPSPLSAACSRPVNGKLEQESESLPTGSTCTLREHENAYMTFMSLIEWGYDGERVQEILPAVFAILVWVHKLCTLRPRLGSCISVDAESPLLPPKFWRTIAKLLNKLNSLEPIDARMIRSAYSGTMPFDHPSERSGPLREDWLIRELRWTRSVFPQLWFSGHTQNKIVDGRETDLRRVKRVQCLGVRLSSMIQNLEFNAMTGTFSTQHNALSADIEYMFGQVAKLSIVQTPPPASQCAPNDQQSESTTYEVKELESQVGVLAEEAARSVSDDDFLMVENEDED